MSKQPVLLLLVACFAALLIAGSAQAGGPNLEPGKWEITTKVKIPGMPAEMANREFVHTQCLTEEDFVPRGSQASSGDCEIRDINQRGNTVTWTMHCSTGQGDMDGEGRIVYSGDTFSGNITTNMPGMQIKQQMKGRRLGPCE
jgi:hypothetical protein